MESESPIILQMLKNVKTLIEVSKERDCWSLEELKNIDITEHNVSEILKQLLEKQPDKNIDKSVEINDTDEMEEID